jgi:hypothetical protein
MIIKKHKHDYGDIRKRKIFAFLPKRLDKQTLVWLEWVTITESRRTDYWIIVNVERSLER